MHNNSASTWLFPSRGSRPALARGSHDGPTRRMVCWQNTRGSSAAHPRVRSPTLNEHAMTVNELSKMIQAAPAAQSRQKSRHWQSPRVVTVTASSYSSCACIDPQTRSKPCDGIEPGHIGEQMDRPGTAWSAKSTGSLAQRLHGESAGASADAMMLRTWGRQPTC
jgi:hypothetical protein